ncbi:MAG: HD domain-containing protein [Desulfatitalea sp.]|nr:HD domain-containing protein [Desulfatitalea sp.]NNK01391.1 HD domain-containing protein [Desulfatitalea sp.]
MKPIALFIFEALFLKRVPRSGYQFLGAGKETVAEHVYAVTMIAYVLSKLTPGADAERLMAMCLIHDLPEARLGDLNYVQKQYVSPDEQAALTDMLDGLPFANQVAELLKEFNNGASLEARLARDADQLALIVDLKALKDLGYNTPDQWLPHVRHRLVTKAAVTLADALVETPSDEWWFRLFY